MVAAEGLEGAAGLDVGAALACRATGLWPAPAPARPAVRDRDAAGSFSAPTPPENALANAWSAVPVAARDAASVAAWDGAGRAVLERCDDPPPPAAACEIENAAANAATASTNPVARSLTTSPTHTGRAITLGRWPLRIFTIARSGR